MMAMLRKSVLLSIAVFLFVLCSLEHGIERKVQKDSMLLAICTIRSAVRQSWVLYHHQHDMSME
jgi:hypothetical protein